MICDERSQYSDGTILVFTVCNNYFCKHYEKNSQNYGHFGAYDIALRDCAGQKTQEKG